ncbi:MAG: hypothetical protein GXO74_02530 [Calditrichaeota bacterium]|nr:hypothetical protein [Calditrichota bacterium]
MRNKMSTLLAGLFVFLLFSVVAVFAQQTDNTKAKVKTQQQVTVDPSKMQHGYHFVDKNGDGFNDNAPDHDGDGIPNGVDPDYTGPKNRKAGQGKNFIDRNGDGINDNQGSGKGFRGHGRRGGFGSGNKVGNGNRTGVCDGTGPKGNRANQPNK